MKISLFGYVWSMTLKKKPKPLDEVSEARQRLINAAEEVTSAWEDCRDRKMWLNLWIDWPSKQVQVTQMTRGKVIAPEYDVVDQSNERLAK